MERERSYSRKAFARARNAGEEPADASTLVRGQQLLGDNAISFMINQGAPCVTKVDALRQTFVAVYPCNHAICAPCMVDQRRSLANAGFDAEGKVSS